jgi:hypothetical protein
LRSGAATTSLKLKRHGAWVLTFAGTTKESPSMPHLPSAYDVHQRERWLRHDAHLWIRHDAARFLPPGTDPEEVYPQLKRQREAAEDAAFAAKIAASQRVLEQAQPSRHCP